MCLPSKEVRALKKEIEELRQLLEIKENKKIMEIESMKGIDNLNIIIK